MERIDELQAQVDRLEAELETMRELVQQVLAAQLDFVQACRVAVETQVEAVEEVTLEELDPVRVSTDAWLARIQARGGRR